MFDVFKERRLKKTLGLENPAKPFSSRIAIALSGSAMAIGTFVAVTAHGASLGTLMLMGAGAATGGAVRLSRDLDIFAVDARLRGKQGRFSNLVYRAFNRTPLRFATINYIGRQFDNLVDERRHRERAAVQRRAKLNPDDHRVVNTQMEERTVRYVKKVTDSRRHLRYIFGLALLGGAVLRDAGNVKNGRLATPLQFISRIGGIAATATMGISHVHAYVKKRAVEADPRPIFVIAAKYMQILPTKYLADWMIRRDVAKINDLEAGRQVWGWRMTDNIAKHLPFAPMRRQAEKILDRRRMSLTERVVLQLNSDGISPKIVNLKSFGHPGQPGTSNVNCNIRDAYDDLMRKMDDERAAIEQAYKVYRDDIEDKNQVKRQLYAIFNGRGRLDRPVPLVEPDKIMKLDLPFGNEQMAKVYFSRKMMRPLERS